MPRLTPGARFRRSSGTFPEQRLLSERESRPPLSSAEESVALRRSCVDSAERDRGAELGRCLVERMDGAERCFVTFSVVNLCENNLLRGFEIVVD